MTPNSLQRVTENGTRCNGPRRVVQRERPSSVRRRRSATGERRASRSGWRGQGGAVLVEAALVLPVILTLMLGIMEFGLIFKDTLTIANGTRAGARIGSSDGQSTLADYDILKA